MQKMVGKVTVTVTVTVTRLKKPAKITAMQSLSESF
jgi:hypothetical protein